MPRNTDALVIGAGQAGLAMSHCLTRLGIDHAVLERGRIAERWRTERWASLRLLTPNWMTRLPGGWAYAGAEPDGFMTMQEVIALLDDYAGAFAAPVHGHTAVRMLRPAAGGFLVETDRGVAWRARIVVIATGHCDRPAIPAMARGLPAGMLQVTPSGYLSPGQLPAGGVLVVGASASGVQLAEEIQRSGRPVTLAVGRHTRLPRRWRGRDIMDWMSRAGILQQRAEEVRDIAAARAQPSLQLAGRADGSAIDLGTLQAMGVRILGRALGIAEGRVHLAEDLAATVADSERRLLRTLGRIRPFADAEGAPAEEWPAPPVLQAACPPSLDLAAEGIRSVVWATGWRRDYRWLRVPGVLDAQGEIIHRGGVTEMPGLYVLGLRFLRRRNSSFIDGVGADAEALALHALGHLAGRAAA